MQNGKIANSSKDKYDFRNSLLKWVEEHGFSINYDIIVTVL
jgi:hypothetical protein